MLLKDALNLDAIQFDDLSVAPDNPPVGSYRVYGLNGVPFGVNSGGTSVRLGGSLGVAQPAPTELTIASGAITLTQGFHRIDTEADASSDNLDTINGGVTNAIYLLRPENAARTVVVRSGAGNIRTMNGVSISLSGLNDSVLLWYDGSTYNVINNINNPQDLPDWGAFAPDASVKIAMQDSAGDFFEINGEEMKPWSVFQLNADISFDAVGNLHALFDSTTAFTMTINASTIISGMEWKVQVLQAPGAGTHKLLLPSGVTWDGTNRAALFDNTADYLRGSFISATRFLLDPTTTGVTYSAS